MTDYVEFTEMKETLELRSETFADDDLKLAITAASETIDSICGRTFAPPGDDDTTRLFEAKRERWIEIDDCSTITTVESGQTTFKTWAEEAFTRRPLNYEAEGVPIQELRLTPSGSLCLTPGQTIVKVTGKFGWETVPTAIKQATILLASRYMKRAREAPFGVAGIGADGMAVRIGYSDPDVKSLLAPFTRPVRLA